MSLNTSRPGSLALLLSVNVLDNGHSVAAGNGVQFGKLRVNGKHLAVFVFARFAAVNEVFKHGRKYSKRHK